MIGKEIENGPAVESTSPSVQPFAPPSGAGRGPSLKSSSAKTAKRQAESAPNYMYAFVKMQECHRIFEDVNMD